MSVFAARVQNFYKLLDEQVVEMEFEESGKIQVQICFDAKDMRYALFGVSNLFDGHRFATDLFRADAAMVQCLGFGGWLGRIHMLQPHQSELLAALRRPNFGKIEDWSRFVRDFLQEISYKQQIPPFRHLSPKALYDHIKQYVGSTYEAFKAFQFVLNASDWRMRLKRMRTEGVWDISLPGRVDPKSLDSEEFNHFKKEIDSRRHKTPLNNFADAVAMSILKESVARFNSGKENTLRIYFDTTAHGGNEGFFRQIAVSTGTVDRYRYWLDDKSYSVLKPASYFRFKGMFRSSRAEFLGAERPPLLQAGGLRVLRDELADLLKARKITEDMQISFVGASLGELLRNIEDLSFFKYVWESNVAEEEAKIILEELNLSILADRDFARGVEQALDNALRELSRNTEDYRWISNLWLKLRSESFSLVRFNDLDRDFRLTRFSLPSVTLVWVGGILHAFGQSEDDSERRSAFQVVVEELSAVMRKRNVPGDDDEMALYIRSLALACSLLWLLEMYDELIALFEEQDMLLHHSFRMMYAASLVKKRAKLRGGGERSSLASLSDVQIQQKIKNLDHEFEMASEADRRQEVRAELAVGLAYLCFEYLLSVGFVAKWREGDRRSSLGLSDDKVKDYFDKAVKYAQQACDLLGGRDEFKSMYALNQKLYYLVEGGDDGRVKEIMLLARDLLRAKEINPDYWQYTYDDTLARYEHRLSFLERDTSRKIERLHEALRLAESAVSGSYQEDQQMISYRDQVRADLLLAESQIDSETR